MKRDLLLAIADVVDETPDANWEMRVWRNACGMVGCAIGNAMKAGLLPDLSLDACTLVYRTDNAEDYDEGYGAAGKATGITEQQAERLFNPDAYDEDHWEEYGSFTARLPQFEVSKRIREFVYGADNG